MANSDATDWWYYFDKVDDNKYAKCKHCDWKKPRDKYKSTKLLKYHLEHYHPEQYSKKLEAERMSKKKEEERKRTNSTMKHQVTKYLKYLIKAVARVQVAEYISEAPIPLASDPYKYWLSKKNANKWPVLWPLVRRFLSAPCGSVESERLFSQAKNITTDLRKRLSPDNLKKLLLIHENLPLINFEY
jgi:hypothetical protein